ncbi:hypothetical protein LZC95_33320 [Pendulispora brunnea]|uniref:Uncharacterized protein n=1 Tax=Pendulispora brunnea TaxID=2905690 RepID=A0ABZ2JZU0_9BACT
MARGLLLACLASAGALSFVLGACGSDSANPGGGGDGPGADAGPDGAWPDGSLADGAKPPGPWTTRGICSKDAWCWDHPLPQGNLLKDVWAAASNDVWAVGDGGTIVHFDGTQWSSAPSGTKADLRSIHGAGAKDMWAVASDGAIAHYDGNGWKIATTLEDAILGEVLALGPADVWVAGQTFSGAPYGRKGVLAHFDGTSWTKVNTGISLEYYYGITSMWGTSSNDLYFVSGDVYHWNGTRAERQLLPERGSVAHTFSKIWGTAPNDVWVVGSNRDEGIIWHYDGAAWSIVFTDNRNMRGPRTVWGTSRTDVWVAGYLASGRYGTLHWDGTAWTAAATEAAIPASATPSDGWSIGAKDAWLVGEPGVPWHWNGTKWENDPGFDVGVRGFWGTSPDDVWAVGHLGNDTIYCSDAKLLHGTAAGTWTQQPADTVNGLWRIWGAGSNDIWAVASPKPRGPALYRYDGQNWAPISTTTTTDVYLHDVWGAAGNDVWIAGEYRLSHWNGTEFKNFATHFNHYARDIFHAVWGLSSNDVWTYGGLQCYYDPGGPPCTTDQDIRHWDGTKWNPLSNSTIAVKSFGGSSSTDVFAVGVVPEKPNAPIANKPRIEHWDGHAWTAMRLPEGTKGPLYAVWAGSPNEVYAVGEGGTILYYDGTQWSLLESGTTLPLYSVWGTDANHIFIGGQSSAILRRDR